jgi:hypothetical protein
MRDLSATDDGATDAALSDAAGVEAGSPDLALTCTPACTAPRTCNGGVCSGCSGALPGPSMVDVGTFCIDSTEVTQAQYQAFLSASVGFAGQPAICAGNTSWQPLTTSMECSATTWDPVNHATWPAGCVTWCAAYAYCKWAGKRLCGKIGGGSLVQADYNNASKSQWYFVCTDGGQAIARPFSPWSTNTCQAPRTTFGDVPTQSCSGSVAPWSNIFDLIGNAWEWEDLCFSNGGTYCALRGGGYNTGPNVPPSDPAVADYYQCAGAGGLGPDAFPVLAVGGGIRCCAD